MLVSEHYSSSSSDRSIYAPFAAARGATGESGSPIKSSSSLVFDASLAPAGFFSKDSVIVVCAAVLAFFTGLMYASLSSSSLSRLSYERNKTQPLESGKKMVIKEWNRGSAYDLRLLATLPVPFAGAARTRSSPESSSSPFTAGSFGISTSELYSLVSKDAFLVVIGAARLSAGGGSSSLSSSSRSSSSSSRLNSSSDVDDASVVDTESSSSESSPPRSSWLSRSICRGVPARGFGCSSARWRARLRRRRRSFRASRASRMAMKHNAAAAAAASSSSRYISAL
ncbi:hypothetical protein EDB83DRAFT_708003 [Lactarius deliciosus]|nr:hypothetical protein EDB83DRAFT_708003 [Lactarius deliciosus]